MAARAKLKATMKAKLKVLPIPKGYPPLMPVTVIARCAEAIAFYKKVFGGRERMRFEMPGGMIAHAELGFGPAVLMMSDPMPGFAEPAPTRLCLYTRNCDAVFAAAVKEGATGKQAPADQFYGDRTATLVDPFGVEWSLMTHIEDVSVREMKKRMANMPSQLTRSGRGGNSLSGNRAGSASSPARA